MLYIVAEEIKKEVANMKVYDVRIPIHETPEGEPPVDETIGKLDEMLTQYGIDHCFTLPSSEEIEADPKPLSYHLYYQSEQNVEVTLVVSLYIKLYLNEDKQKILEAIVKSFGNH